MTLLVLFLCILSIGAVLVHTRHEGAGTKRNWSTTNQGSDTGSAKDTNGELAAKIQKTEHGSDVSTTRKKDGDIDQAPSGSWWEKAGAIAGGASLLTLPLMFIPMGGGGGGDDLQSQLQNTDPMPVIVSSSSSSCISLTLVVLMITVLLV